MAPDDWSSSNADSKVNNVTDATDGEYILETTSGESQRFTVSDGSASIPDGATVDSIVAHYRTQCSGCSEGNTLLLRWRSDGTGNFCDASTNTVSGLGWTNLSKKITLFPGAGTCTGTLTESRVDSLNLQFNISGKPTGEIRITECSVVVWYTEAGGGGEVKGRRRILGDIGGYEEFSRYAFGDGNFVIGFREPHWFWMREI